MELKIGHILKQNGMRFFAAKKDGVCAAWIGRSFVEIRPFVQTNKNSWEKKRNGGGRGTARRIESVLCRYTMIRPCEKYHNLDQICQYIASPPPVHRVST